MRPPRRTRPLFDVAQLAARARKDEELLETLLRVYGYYEGEVIRTIGTRRAGEDSADRRPRVRFDVIPGERYRFGAIDLGALATAPDAATRDATLRNSLPGSFAVIPAETFQNSRAFSIGDMIATVIQTGSDNSSDVTQLNRQQTATVDQSGDNGTSIVFQQGRRNFATLDQAGTDNVSIIDQDGGPASGGIGQEAFVTQSGIGNTSDIFQAGRNPGQPNDGINYAEVFQDGSDDEAVITQIDQARSDEAYISQSATSTSYAEVFQSGDEVGGAPDTDNVADISQANGSDNFSFVNQGDTTFFGGNVGGATNAFAQNIQDGSDLSSDIIQGGDASEAFVVQGASDNESLVIQGDFGGSGGLAFVGQAGTNGLSLVFQNSDLSQVFVAQISGDNNFSAVDQGFANGAGAGADGNFARVSQEGDNNSSEITQNLLDVGGGNIADVLQENGGNLSSIIQEGSTNSATVSQYDGSTSFVTQDGTGNVVTVTQGTP
mgnify:CR=1 FL=1